MKTIFRLAATAAAATLLAGGVTAATAAPSSAATTLGGVNASGWCKASSPGTQHAAWPANASNPYSWRCSFYNLAGQYTLTGMDFNRACRWQYGGGAYAVVTNQQSAYSWVCMR